MPISANNHGEGNDHRRKRFPARQPSEKADHQSGDAIESLRPIDSAELTRMPGPGRLVGWRSLRKRSELLLNRVTHARSLRPVRDILVRLCTPTWGDGGGRPLNKIGLI